MNSSTITVQNMVDWARVHNELQPFIGLGGLANEPALRIANEVKLAIIKQSYNWEWNRRTMTPFLTVENIWEYPILAPDLGWLEDGYFEWNADTATPKQVRPLEIRKSLKRPFHKDDPVFVATDVDDNGQRVIRVSPIPANTAWMVYLRYQMQPSLITQLTGGENQDGTFYPIPDDMGHVISQFFLAFCFRIAKLKNQYYGELAEAIRRITEFRGSDSNESTGTVMTPESDFFDFYR